MKRLASLVFLVCVLFVAVLVAQNISGPQQIELNTVSQLSLAGRGMRQGDIAIVSSFSTVADAGGGRFYLDRTGTRGVGAADGGIIVQASGGNDWYWVRIFDNGDVVTPQMFGAKADAVDAYPRTGTDDTAAVEAAFANTLNLPVCLEGKFLVSGTVEVSTNGQKVFGGGSILQAEDADAINDSGVLYVTGSEVTVEGITVKGNSNNPGDVGFAKPILVVGNNCVIRGCRAFDSASGNAADSTSQDNISVEGDGNKIVDCYSEGSSYAGYANSGRDNQFINCIFRRGTAPSTITRAFNGTGGSSKMCNTLVIDGFNADDSMVLDWASENSPALVENIVVNNCYVRSVDDIALKLAHARNVVISNSHFEAVRASQEAVVFGERLYDVRFVSTFMRAGFGSASSNSHIEDFGEGNKHLSMNSLTLDTCVIGGTGLDPHQLWDNIAINVRCFKFTMVNSRIYNFGSIAIKSHPQETGVVEVRTTAPPALSGSDNVYIVGAGSQSGAWAAIPLHSLAWDNGTWVFEEPSSHGADDTSTNNTTTMTDSGESWVADQFNGWTIHNLTDISADGTTVASGIVTDTTTNTIVVASLTGGTDNDWDTGDLYKVSPPFEYAELKYDTRAYNEDNAVDDWLMFVNDDDGWVVVPDDMYGLDIHGNTFTGWRDSAVLVAIDDGETIHQDKFLRKSNLNRFYDNKIVNLGTGGATQETVSTGSINAVFQQKGPGLWWSAAVPTVGLWLDGDRVDRVPATVGQPQGWIQNADGVPSFTALPNL